MEITVRHVEGRRIGMRFDELEDGRGLVVKSVNPAGLAADAIDSGVVGAQLVSISGSPSGERFDCKNASKQKLKSFVQMLYVPGATVTLSFQLPEGAHGSITRVRSLPLSSPLPTVTDGSMSVGAVVTYCSPS